MSRYGLLFALFLFGSLCGCSRTVMIQVLDAQSQEPIVGATVCHERAEWRLLGLVPYKYPILKQSKVSDNAGLITFEGVRQDDIVTIVIRGNGYGKGYGKHEWFSPLWPLEQARSGPTNFTSTYRAWNRATDWDDKIPRLILPIKRE